MQLYPRVEGASAVFVNLSLIVVLSLPLLLRLLLMLLMLLMLELLLFPVVHGILTMDFG
jgi:hypothetical protein